MAIVVIGDTMLDCYRTVVKSEWDAGIEAWAYETTEELRCPGGAANVAMNARALGAAAELVSVVGRDWAGQYALEFLMRARVGLEGTQSRSDYLTPCLMRVTGVAGVPGMRLDRGGGWCSTAGIASAGCWEERVNGAAVAVVADYGRYLDKTNARAIISACERRGVLLLVDATGNPAAWYKGSTALKVNRSQAEHLCGARGASAEALARRISSEYDLRFAVVTCAADGAVAVTAEGTVLSASHSAHCVNPTGGGDALLAGLAVGLAAGRSLQESLENGVFAAASAVGTRCTCPREPCVSKRDG